MKKPLAIFVLILIASLSIAGCTSSTTSPTSSNQTASSTSQAASTTVTKTHTTTKASAPTAAPNATTAPTARIPTSISIFAMPQAVVPNAPISATFQTNPVPLTINVYVNGKFVGTATPTIPGNVGNFSFAEHLAPAVAGNWSHRSYPLTLSFPGNAQYAASSATGYFDVNPAT